MLEVLLTCMTPAGKAASTLTAKVAVPAAAPAFTAPIFRVQLVPAALPFAQLQTLGKLAVALKVVFAGTVSVNTTLAAFWPFVAVAFE